MLYCCKFLVVPEYNLKWGIIWALSFKTFWFNVFACVDSGSLMMQNIMVGGTRGRSYFLAGQEGEREGMGPGTGFIFDRTLVVVYSF